MICRHCGKVITGKGKYCSAKCKQAAYRQRTVTPTVTQPTVTPTLGKPKRGPDTIKPQSYNPMMVGYVPAVKVG